MGEGKVGLKQERREHPVSVRRLLDIEQGLLCTLRIGFCVVLFPACCSIMTALRALWN